MATGWEDNGGTNLAPTDSAEEEDDTVVVLSSDGHESPIPVGTLLRQNLNQVSESSFVLS